METRQCIKCRRNLPESAFPIINGYMRHKCRECMNQTSTEYYNTIGKDKAIAKRLMEARRKPLNANDFGNASLEDITEDALSHGMSYGKWVAEQYKKRGI